VTRTKLPSSLGVNSRVFSLRRAQAAEDRDPWAPVQEWVEALVPDAIAVPRGRWAGSRAEVVAASVVRVQAGSDAVLLVPQVYPRQFW
jgi:hypothetical protein